MNKERIIFCLILTVTVAVFEFVYINKDVPVSVGKAEIHEYFYGSSQYMEQSFKEGYMMGAMNIHNNSGVFDKNQSKSDSLKWHEHITDDRLKIK